MDLVGHDGGSVYGEYCQTLDRVDVAAGWSEQRAVATKAQCRVLEAIRTPHECFPFRLKGLDSDNATLFADHECIAKKLGLRVYFAVPYASY